MTTDLIAEPFELASRLHAGQKDKGGHPYIFHPIHVALDCQ